MRESLVDDYLVESVQLFDGLAYKVKLIGRRGFNDRLVVLAARVLRPSPPDAWIAFVETKASGKKPRQNQSERHAELRARFARVYVIDSKEGVDSMIDDYLHNR